jgi:hypothetical protein
MPSKPKIDAIADRIDRLHRERIKPPFHRWVEAQSTPTLLHLRAELERGVPLITAIERIATHVG